MAKPDALHVEVVYALPERQAVVALRLESGTSVRDALAHSGLLQRFAELDPARLSVGIFGHAATLDTPLQDGDRVEIYRPLERDPKQARRELAKAGRTMGRAGKD
ncbi:MAG TPA: RnfH family protein [Gammaproteobacteria bacterium]|nr:RnfH family protein [Gammaproteobacteria bacterium]